MRVVALFSLIAVSPVAHTQSDNLAAHVHGAANAQLTFDGSDVQMVLTVPMIDVAGFEGNADTDERKARLDAGLRALEAVARAARFAGGECTSRTAQAASQGDEHADEHEHDHDHDHDHGHAEEHAHSDAMLKAAWTCSGDIRALTFDPWQSFPTLETVSFEWIKADGQGSAKLARGTTDLPL